MRSPTNTQKTLQIICADLSANGNSGRQKDKNRMTKRQNNKNTEIQKHKKTKTKKGVEYCDVRAVLHSCYVSKFNENPKPSFTEPTPQQHNSQSGLLLQYQCHSSSSCDSCDKYDNWPRRKLFCELTQFSFVVHDGQNRGQNINVN